MASGPLEGIRILEFTQIIAGPFACQNLADMGAEVIKVEPPEGDIVRLIAPHHDQGMSAFYHFVNVGKRSICVDLKTEAGKQIVLDLFAVCDAVDAASSNCSPKSTATVFGRCGDGVTSEPLAAFTAGCAA